MYYGRRPPALPRVCVCVNEREPSNNSSSSTTRPLPSHNHPAARRRRRRDVRRVERRKSQGLAQINGHLNRGPRAPQWGPDYPSRPPRAATGLVQLVNALCALKTGVCRVRLLVVGGGSSHRINKIVYHVVTLGVTNIDYLWRFQG